MTAIWALTAQVIMIAIAYPTACLGGATLAGFALAQRPIGEILRSFHLSMTLLGTISAVWWDALVTAFWPAVVMVLISEGMKVRGLLAHVIAGCCVGLLRALPVGSFLVGAQLEPVETAAAQLSVAAGALGGLIYWAIAGRTAGRWLELRWFAPQR